MTDIQKEFEIWATGKGFNLTKSHDGTYVYRPAYYTFLGWIESRGLSLSFAQRIYMEDAGQEVYIEEKCKTYISLNDI